MFEKYNINELYLANIKVDGPNYNIYDDYEINAGGLLIGPARICYEYVTI